jgi:hypothetical protein
VTPIEAFLAIIALATLTTAVVQVVVLVSARRVAERTIRLLDRLEQEVPALMSQLTAMVREGSHAAAIAAAQVERTGLMFADVAGRVERTFDTVQGAMAGPMLQGAALLQAGKAVLGAIRRRGGRSGQRMDDEDPLFI